MDKINCLLNGACCPGYVIYKVGVKDERGSNRVHLDCTEGTFKERWYNHRPSYRQKSHRYCTKLANYLWELKEKIIEAQI